MVKDEQIRFLVNSELKENFKKACDGRPMTVVIIKLMEAYINDRNIPDNKQGK